ncbi:methylenetetrahydrofolate reductase [Thalassiosira pseudonana CCMP1335]|uniref:Methylenetetrahydrofolate reductase n=1 Tax=Thalassiosira pseudonana TaxID=35128 RepID=B8BVS6_THAPS|nr:methylenetetrahydrofolate reductase [Thalassiosira pseudonana CCMP1335]EED95512.1 methylenetetrahydrofolate reductase [Thalassiosira pseudonana CCMP1335]
MNGHTERQPDPKIIDLLQRDTEIAHVSLEYFPPRTDQGVKNLHARMDRMLVNTNALYTDMTWGAGGSTADLSLELALHAHKTGHVSNMHLTCTNMEKDGDPVKAVHDALQQAYDGGIRNIVALRGDPPEGEKEWTATEGGFSCALDLVKYIRKTFGDKFGISVAGYPEGHPNRISQLSEEEDEDYKKEMDYLKEKVDAGGDFIITQMFFDAEVFKTFVNDCRTWGITCPVVPGLMCINAYPGFKKMTKFCKTRVPKSLEERMDAIKDDADAVKKFGVEFGAEISRNLLDSGVKILHFYTLNLEKVVYGITDELGITSGLIEKSEESDAKDMVAVGSAWARAGDTVKFSTGQGVVKEIKSDGTAVVELDGKDVEFAKGSYEKVF